MRARWHIPKKVKHDQGEEGMTTMPEPHNPSTDQTRPQMTPDASARDIPLSVRRRMYEERKKGWRFPIIVLIAILVIAGINLAQKVHMNDLARSPETTRLIRKNLRGIDPNAFTGSGAIKSYHIKFFSASRHYSEPGFSVVVVVQGDGWEEEMNYVFEQKLNFGPYSNMISPEPTMLYKHLEKHYGKEYVRILKYGDAKTLKSRWGKEKDEDENDYWGADDHLDSDDLDEDDGTAEDGYAD